MECGGFGGKLDYEGMVNIGVCFCLFAGLIGGTGVFMGLGCFLIKKNFHRGATLQSKSDLDTTF